MSRFMLSLMLAGMLGMGALQGAQAQAQLPTAQVPSGAPVARGLIVKLKEPQAGDPTSAQRERPQRLQERLAAVAQDAGMFMRGQAAIGGGHHLMRFARPLEGRAVDDALRRLRLHPDVAWVEPDVLMKLAQVAPNTAPNDPDYAAGLQDHLKGPAIYPGGINLPPAWNRTTGGVNATVAVLDTGVRFSHPDLAGRVLPGYDFVSEVEYGNDGDGRDADASDPGDWVSTSDRTTQRALYGACLRSDSTWHGTFIAGQLSALTNNGVGVAGINWSNKVLPVRVSGKCGAFLSDILDGMRWAAGLTVAGAPANPNPARIINLSFGGDVACTASYQDIINEVTAAGALVVVAAGNDNLSPKRPADCKNVLTVGAVQRNGLKTDYSSFGLAVGIMAPGGTGVATATATTNIYSTGNDGATSPGNNVYSYKVGTSFSTPLAAGVASLMLALNPALTPAELTQRLRASVRPHVFLAGSPSCGPRVNVPCNCTTSTCGAGLLDADGAVLAALAPVALFAGVVGPVAGSTISLDGRASAASTGSALVSYLWTQVAGSTVIIQNPASAVASVALPAAAGNFQFKLVVTDNAGRQGEQVLSVTSFTAEAAAAAAATSAAAGGGTAASGGGGGGGSMGWLWGAGLWLVALAAWRRRRGLAALQP
ncbi:MAG: S8 family peptidase [Bdellovibrionales bacterium]|nr:S8 family peptidase [Ramlibacter sp.]